MVLLLKGFLLTRAVAGGFLVLSCFCAGSFVGWSLFRFSLDGGAPTFGGSVLVRSCYFPSWDQWFSSSDCFLRVGERPGVVFWLALQGIPALLLMAPVSSCLLFQRWLPWQLLCLCLFSVFIWYWEVQDECGFVST